VDCTPDFVTLTTGETDDTYFFDQGSTTYQPIVTQDIPYCALVYVLLVDNSPTFDTSLY